MKKNIREKLEDAHLDFAGHTVISSSRGARSIRLAGEEDGEGTVLSFNGGNYDLYHILVRAIESVPGILDESECEGYFE